MLANKPTENLHESTSFEILLPIALLVTALAWLGFWVGYDLFWGASGPESNHTISVAHDQFWKLVGLKYTLPLRIILGIIFAGAGFLMGMPLGYVVKLRCLKRTGTTTALVLLLVILSVLSGEMLYRLYQSKAIFGYYNIAKSWELFYSPYTKGISGDFLGLIKATIAFLLKAVVGLTIYYAAQRGLVTSTTSKL